ncbi:MAG TPA: sigma-70 family RNA polymerase sigma factor [Chitinophagaceae bacterium]
MRYIDERVGLFEKIFYSTKDKLYGFAKKILKDDSKVQDCMQQCYMKLWERIDVIDTEKEVLPLLYTFTRNICIDHLRKNARDVLTESLEPFLNEKSDNNIDAYIEAKDSRTELDELFKKLPPRRREVYTLVKLHGFSYRQVSEQLNISVSTVEKHVHEATKTLLENSVIKLAIIFLIIRTC